MYRVLLLMLCVSSALCANILYVAPMPSPSHHIWNRALVFELVNKGHNVTHIGPDVEKAKNANYTPILLEGMYDKLEEEFDMIDLASKSPYEMMLEFKRYSLTYCRTYANKNRGLQQILDYPNDFKFDLVVFDITAGGCLYPLIQKFNYPPTVAVTPFPLPYFILYSFGNHVYPAYVPWYNFPYTPIMTFSERVWNSIYMYLDVVMKHPQQQKDIDQIMKGVFGPDADTVEKIERHVSIVLANVDPILGHPQPYAPNIIPVGGLHTRPSKDLPQDLQAILDNAKNGVILFSLGTNVRSDKLTKEIQRGLLDAFSQISETVIWKFESDIDNLPKNVIVRKWLPQNDVLGHPNVKLFIGHCGGLSTQETMFHGVPILCIPFFLDQHINRKNIVHRELGISLDFRKITPEYVLGKLREILDNPIYKENIQKLSRVFRDRTETPLERAVFWTEYVLRHGGAQFLSTPARDLPFCIASGLDVLAFLVLILVLVILLVYKTVRGILRALGIRKKVKTN